MKLFVTGLSGLLGLNLAFQAREAHRVEGSVHTHNVSIPGVKTHKIDLTAPSSLDPILRASRPDLIVHTAGLTNVDECERRPADARRHNADASKNVAEAAARHAVRLLHLSTDHLFDGKTPLATEDEPPAPVNAYARSKLQAERYVGAANPDATIVRTNFYGWGTRIRPSFSDWILDALRSDQELKLFSDVHYTPIQLNDLIDVLLALGARKAPGVYNVVGSERLTKYEFGIRLAKRFGFAGHRLRAATMADVSLTAKRPQDLSLSAKKVEALLGRTMPNVAQGLERLAQLEAAGRAHDVRQAIPSPSLSR